MMFEYLAPQYLNYAWATARPMLEKAFRYIFHADCVDDYYDPIAQGDMQLWLAHTMGDIRGAVVTKVEECSQGKVVSILLIGGEDIAEWIGEMNEKLTLFARENDCKAIEAVTRPGFSRFVTDFKEDGRIYVKVIS